MAFVMKTCALLGVLACCIVPGVATAQTARTYFSELRAAKALGHYGDEYVCFPDEDKGGFDIVAKTKDIDKMMTAATGVTPKRLGNDALVVKRYFKGVASGQPSLFEKVSKDSDEEWGLDFKSPFRGKMVYLFNWTTGRYRLEVFNLGRSKTLPAATSSGKCELIHPWSSALPDSAK